MAKSQFRFKSKGLDELVARAASQGWRVEKGGSHVLCFPLDGSRPIAVSTTAYDGKVVAIAASQFKRSGLK